MVALGQHCPQLSKLTFEFCDGLDADLFSALQGCPSEEIDITGCHLDRMKTPHLAKEIALAVTGFQQLSSLQIQDNTNNYSSFFSSNHITDRTLDAIPTYLSRIKEVRVYCPPGLTAEGICRL